MAKSKTKEVVKESTPKTFTQPDIINEDFILNDEELMGEDEIEDFLFQETQISPVDNLDEILEVNLQEVVVAARILIHNLDGIFIGGHAQQAKENLSKLISNI